MASKYDLLRDYLNGQRFSELTLSFRDIEKIIGSHLPRSAERPQWWANETSKVGYLQRRAWLDAKFDAFLIPGARKVQFLKAS